MKNIGLALCLLCAVVMVFNVSCATILDGSKSANERTSDIQWGYFILDLFTTGLLGIIVDFSTGAIYSSSSPGSNLEQDIKHHLTDLKMPVYQVADDKVFEVSISPQGTLRYTEVEKNSIPLRVWATIEGQMK
ncbi:hypothetical protein HY772_06450 [Candidatus Woesearchaeota archaeon]|nr:hypothetical protein [Candidatus Woesearchaeota archaeon]